MVRPISLPGACRLLALLFAGLGLCSTAWAEQAPPFPSDPDSWINSGPISVSGLKGKGIVLWFFEEECPQCRARWPEMLEAAKKYDGRPIVFIAVNSGNPKAKLQGYFQQLQTKVPWPILVDTSRDFEKACGLFQEISLQNISQFRYIKPNGEIQPGLTDDIEDAADKAVEGAEWKVDPASVPATLKSAWLAMEFGNYKGLAATLKKSTSSSKADVKEAAGKLMEAVQKEMDEQMVRIKEAQDASNPYRAFELLTELTEHFNGFELPKESATLKKELSKDPKVKAGQTAAKNMEVARKQLAGGNPGQKTKAKATLEKIVADFPDTSLAQQAKAMIDFSSE